MPEINWMDAAIHQAKDAAKMGEVPVGAVLIHRGEIIAEAHNVRESNHDPLGHAELGVLKIAAQKLKRWRLTGCTLVVSLEPCPMCAGAMVNARIDRLVFGAFDKRAGAAGSVYDIVRDSRLNHRIEVTSGVCAEDAASQLSQFFAKRRGKAPKKVIT